MSLADQIVVTGTTLLLADVKARNPGMFDDLDEVALREVEQPARARLLALAAVEQYRANEGPDGRRVVGLCGNLAETIWRNFRDGV